MNKKGVSPVIATVLLITIALILAVIIFLWARSFIDEKTQKFGEPIEYSCEKISFDAEIISLSNGDLTVDVINNGNVALYGLEVRLLGDGSILNVGTGGTTIDNGQTQRLIVSVSDEVSDGSELLLVPVIIGQSGETKKAYTCDEDYGVERTV